MDLHDPIRTALRAHVGDDAADELLAKATTYSNYPNTVKGMAKATSAPAIEAAALAVVEDAALADDALADALGLAAPSGSGLGASPEQAFWALLTLAARADIGVVDRMAGRVGEREYARKLLGSIRRAASKHAKATAGDATATPTAAARPSVPQKVSEVKAWLAAHPDADPAVLAPYDDQRAAARVAAVRALGTMGTPDALAVLGQYADANYPDAVLKELHKAWGNFDRREFAATMWLPGAYTLDLGVAPTIEGIAAVPDLTGLDVVLTGAADLSPLAECTGLRSLRVGAEGTPGVLGVEPLRQLSELTELHLTRTTRNADLTPLADLGVRRLRLSLDGADGGFLLRMPRLERLLLSFASDDDPDAASEAGTPHERRALADVVLALVRKGVRVVVYRHERAWVDVLLAQAEDAPNVFVVEQGGYVALTADESAVDDTARALVSNLLP
jgi:hypothetical protein